MLPQPTWAIVLLAILFASLIILYVCCYCSEEDEEEESKNVIPKLIIPLVVIDSGINYFNHINIKDFMVHCTIPNLVLNALILTSQVKILC